MASFLKDITRFYGNGEKNAAGQTLEEFLDAYDPHKYQTPSCTTDAVIFSYKDHLDECMEGLKLLLIKRGNHPSIGAWALPGGFVNMKENLEDTARRELEEETGISGLLMEQIGTYGDYDRDPRTRVITTAYMSLVKEDKVKVQAGDDAADAAWCDVEFRELDDKKWQLSIYNEAKQIKTTAVVKEYRTEGLIREQKFAVEKPGLLASDHAAIIVHAMTILKKRLQNISE